jgi:hypothetical protein
MMEIGKGVVDGVQKRQLISFGRSNGRVRDEMAEESTGKGNRGEAWTGLERRYEGSKGSKGS